LKPTFLPVDIDDDNFDEEVLDSHLPVVIEFWAEWCGPCRAYKPTILRLAEELRGKAKVGRLDVVKNREITRRLGIRSVPVVLIFKEGKVQRQFLGVCHRDKLKEAVHHILSP
jgi:thioredoxin 1